MTGRARQVGCASGRAAGAEPRRRRRIDQQGRPVRRIRGQPAVEDPDVGVRRRIARGIDGRARERSDPGRARPARGSRRRRRRPEAAVPPTATPPRRRRCRARCPRRRRAHGIGRHPRRNGQHFSMAFAGADRQRSIEQDAGAASDNEVHRLRRAARSWPRRGTPPRRCRCRPVRRRMRSTATLAAGVNTECTVMSWAVGRATRAVREEVDLARRRQCAATRRRRRRSAASRSSALWMSARSAVGPSTTPSAVVAMAISRAVDAVGHRTGRLDRARPPRRAGRRARAHRPRRVEHEKRATGRATRVRGAGLASAAAIAAAISAVSIRETAQRMRSQNDCRCASPTTRVQTASDGHDLAAGARADREDRDGGRRRRQRRAAMRAMGRGRTSRGGCRPVRLQGRFTGDAGSAGRQEEVVHQRPARVGHGRRLHRVRAVVARDAGPVTSQPPASGPHWSPDARWARRDSGLSTSLCAWTTSWRSAAASVAARPGLFGAAGESGPPLACCLPSSSDEKARGLAA